MISLFNFQLLYFLKRRNDIELKTTKDACALDGKSRMQSLQIITFPARELMPRKRHKGTGRYNLRY